MIEICFDFPHLLKKGIILKMDEFFCTHSLSTSAIQDTFRRLGKLPMAASTGDGDIHL